MLLRGVRVWSSGACASPTPQVHTLQPGKPVPLTVSWNRTRSTPGCPSAGAAVARADNGAYTLRGQLSGLPPVAGGTFTLS